MTKEQLAKRILVDMQNVVKQHKCLFSLEMSDGVKPDDFYVKLTAKCKDQVAFNKLKKLEGKYCLPFKFPNFESRQDTIGLCEVKKSGHGSDFFEEWDGDLLMVFVFVEW